jgi:hypothetical protein
VRKEITGKLRKLNNEELHGSYSSLVIVWVIKSRRIKWAGHIECMGKERSVCSVLVRKVQERNHFQDRGNGSSTCSTPRYSM